MSTGNQADLDVVEIANHLLNRTELELLMLYLEQMPRGDEWEAMCARAAEAGKCVAILRSGTTPAGRVAVASHTGALVGPDRAFEVISSKYGVRTVRDADQMLDVALAHRAGLSNAGGRMAIVTTSGGAGGLAADAAVRAGMSVARLQPETCLKLEELLPKFASSQNPVDVTAELVVSHPDRLGEVCRHVSSDPDVDLVMVVISGGCGPDGSNVGRRTGRSAPEVPDASHRGVRRRQRSNCRCEEDPQ